MMRPICVGYDALNTVKVGKVFFVVCCSKVSMDSYQENGTLLK